MVIDIAHTDVPPAYSENLANGIITDEMLFDAIGYADIALGHISSVRDMCTSKHLARYTGKALTYVVELRQRILKSFTREAAGEPGLVRWSEPHSRVKHWARSYDMNPRPLLIRVKAADAAMEVKSGEFDQPVQEIDDPKLPDAEHMVGIDFLEQMSEALGKEHAWVVLDDIVICEGTRSKKPVNAKAIAPTIKSTPPCDETVYLALPKSKRVEAIVNDIQHFNKLARASENGDAAVEVYPIRGWDMSELPDNLPEGAITMAIETLTALLPSIQLAKLDENAILIEANYPLSVFEDALEPVMGPPAISEEFVEEAALASDGEYYYELDE